METYFIFPVIFVLYLFLLKEKSLFNRVFETIMIFCLSVSFFGVLWWMIVPVSNGIANVYFYSTLTILSLVMIYINNIKLQFIKPNKLLYILLPLLIFITYIRYFVPNNDFGVVWVLNRVMELAVWLGFVKLKFFYSA